MLVRRVAVLVACVLTSSLVAPIASADPEAEAVSAEVPAPESAPMDDGMVESSPPVTSHTPDGWTLTVSAKDETQRVIAPLTTAISSREYEVGGTYHGSLSGPEEDGTPEGTLEVGYQIGCGIDMSTSNGVTLNGSVGITPSLGLGGVDVDSPLPEGLIPVVSTPVTGGMSIAMPPVTGVDTTGISPSGSGETTSTPPRPSDGVIPTLPVSVTPLEVLMSMPQPIW